MTLTDICTILKKVGIPLAYKHFTGPKNAIPNPPYLVYYESNSNNFGADNIVFAENNSVIVELYTDHSRDLALEKKVKALLDENEIFYQTSHADISDEDIHIAYFEFQYIN